MYRISGLTLYPMNKDYEDKRYHIEVTDEDEQRIYCTGYIFAEVQNNLLQCYQFSVDLIHESGEKLTYEQISDDPKLRSIINAICGILFNNGIGKK